MKYFCLNFLMLIVSIQAFPKTKDNCHSRAIFSQTTMKVSLDTLCRSIVKFDAINESTIDYCRFSNIIGELRDTSVFLSFSLLKKTLEGHVEEIEFKDSSNDIYYHGKIIPGEKYPWKIFKMAPGQHSWENSFCLAEIFNVNAKGKYILNGYYKTICDGSMEIHSMGEIYIEII